MVTATRSTLSSWSRSRRSRVASSRRGRLAVPVGDPRFDEVRALGDLGKHWLREIETFFATYKELETDKSSDVKGWHDAEVAWKLIGEARDRARGQRRES